MNKPTYLFARDGSMVLIDAHEVPEYIAQGYQDTPDFTEPSEATREELEQKAKELGIKFDGRTSDAKLNKLIAEKV